MPLYEFECPKCGIIEHLCSMSEITETITCECGETAKRVYSIAHAHMQRSPEEMRAMLQKRSREHSAKHITPHRHEIEQRLLRHMKGDE